MQWHRRDWATLGGAQGAAQAGYGQNLSGVAVQKFEMWPRKCSELRNQDTSDMHEMLTIMFWRRPVTGAAGYR